MLIGILLVAPAVAQLCFTADVAFIALAHHHLGQTDEAERALEALRQCMTEERWQNDAESEAFLTEVVEAIEGD